MTTTSTVDLLIRNALHHAGLAIAFMSTRLVEDDAVFETTITPALGRDVELVAMVLRGYHGGTYGTSVAVRGRTVISRQLNK